MRGLQIALAAAALCTMRPMIEVRDDELVRDEPLPPKPRDESRIGYQPEPIVRDLSHPAVIAAQARQARKAQRQAKGFVTPADGPLEGHDPSLAANNGRST